MALARDAPNHRVEVRGVRGDEDGAFGAFEDPIVGVATHRDVRYPRGRTHRHERRPDATRRADDGERFGRIGARRAPWSRSCAIRQPGEAPRAAADCRGTPRARRDGRRRDRRPRLRHGQWRSGAGTRRVGVSHSENRRVEPSSVCSRWRLGLELHQCVPTAVANSHQAQEKCSRELPRLIQRVAETPQTRRRLVIASHASAVVVLGRSLSHTPARLPRLRALARHTPRRSFVRTRRPRLHLGAGNSSIRRVRAREGFRCVPRGSGLVGTARRRAGGVCAAHPH